MEKEDGDYGKEEGNYEKGKRNLWERERKAGAHFSKRKVAKRKLYVSFF